MLSVLMFLLPKRAVPRRPLLWHLLLIEDAASREAFLRFPLAP
jgi:hypothetical protein